MDSQEYRDLKDLIDFNESTLNRVSADVAGIQQTLSCIQSQFACGSSSLLSCTALQNLIKETMCGYLHEEATIESPLKSLSVETKTNNQQFKLDVLVPTQTPGGSVNALKFGEDGIYVDPIEGGNANPLATFEQLPNGDFELDNGVDPALVIPAFEPGYQAPVTVSANYTILPTDHVILVQTTYAGENLTLTLPNISNIPAGKVITIKDAQGDALTYPITVATNGAATIDGASTWQHQDPYESHQYVSDGTNYFIIA